MTVNVEKQIQDFQIVPIENKKKTNKLTDDHQLTELAYQKIFLEQGQEIETLKLSKMQLKAKVTVIQEENDQLSNNLDIQKGKVKEYAQKNGRLLQKLKDTEAKTLILEKDKIVKEQISLRLEKQLARKSQWGILLTGEVMDLHKALTENKKKTETVINNLKKEQSDHKVTKLVLEAANLQKEMQKEKYELKINDLKDINNNLQFENNTLKETIKLLGEKINTKDETIKKLYSLLKCFESFASNYCSLFGIAIDKNMDSKTKLEKIKEHVDALDKVITTIKQESQHFQSEPEVCTSCDNIEKWHKDLKEKIEEFQKTQTNLKTQQSKTGNKTGATGTTGKSKQVETGKKSQKLVKTGKTKNHSIHNIVDHIIDGVIMTSSGAMVGGVIAGPVGIPAIGVGACGTVLGSVAKGISKFIGWIYKK